MKVSKNHVVAVRFSDLEYNFLQSLVDNHNHDTISSVIRLMVRERLLEHERDLEDALREQDSFYGG